MERVLIGLLVLGFMLGTMYVAARLTVGWPKSARQDPKLNEATAHAQTTTESAEFARQVDSPLTSMLN